MLLPGSLNESVWSSAVEERDIVCGATRLLLLPTALESCSGGQLVVCALAGSRDGPGRACCAAVLPERQPYWRWGGGSTVEGAVQQLGDEGGVAGGEHRALAELPRCESSRDGAGWQGQGFLERKDPSGAVSCIGGPAVGSSAVLQRGPLTLAQQIRVIWVILQFGTRTYDILFILASPPSKV